MAQWIRRLPTEQEILGSSPSTDSFLFQAQQSLFSFFYVVSSPPRLVFPYFSPASGLRGQPRREKKETKKSINPEATEEGGGKQSKRREGVIRESNP
jgi:hypothetical protein